MGLILDTDVLIRAERMTDPIDFGKWSHHGEAFISAITCSELLVGVHLANTEARRLKRAAFVEGLLRVLQALPFDIDVARVHAQLIASLPRNVTLGAHDLIIGATALRYGYPADRQRGRLPANAGDNCNRHHGLSLHPHHLRS